MELQDLEIFTRVARDGSFSRAAAALSMGQPAVSTRIAALETEVGARLFVRTHRGAVLNGAGQALLPYATRCLELAAEAASVARVAGATHRLYLAAVSSLAEYVLPAVLAGLKDAPVQVFCRSDHAPEVKQLVLDGVAQAGFLFAGPVQSGLRLQLLHRDPILCVAPRDHPLAAARRVPLTEVTRHPLAPFSWGPGFDDLLELLLAHGLPPTGLRAIAPAPVARELVLTHGYVSFMPRLTVARDLGAGVLAAVDVVDLPIWTWDIAVTYRDRADPPGGLRAFLQALQQITWPS